MIKKSFELKNEILRENYLFLFYGQNEGLKNQVIESLFKKNYLESTYQYEESEIIKNEEGFFNNILSKSFFENEKLIIINRVSDKIKEIAEELIDKQVEGLIIILNAKNLEKKYYTSIDDIYIKTKEILKNNY